MERPILDYYGGKFVLRNWIISNMPSHKIYVEPFGGGASVLLAKDPAKVEVYNDIDDEVVNFFQVVKNNGNEIHRRLSLTPYSRSEYLNSRNYYSCNIERAVNLVVRSFMGIGDSIHNASGFRNSKTSNTSPGKTFRNYVDYFPDFIERLRPVIIENLDYKEIFKKYDSKDTLFYLDPPYLWGTRSKKHSYGHEMSDEDHGKMIELIGELKGSVILSGYENEIYGKLGFEKIERKTRTQKNESTEVLWISRQDFLL